MIKYKNDPIKKPDHFPRTLDDWRDMYNARRPVFDRSKTGQRLNTLPLDPDAIVAVDEQLEKELS